MTHHTFEAGHTWLVALLVFGTWLFVDWVALACKWNFHATAVDALVERSHTGDLDLHSPFFSRSPLLPAEARVAPTYGHLLGRRPDPLPLLLVCFVSRRSFACVCRPNFDTSWLVLCDCRGVPHLPYV